MSRNEDAKDAAVRELQEETGLVISAENIEFLYRHSVLINGTECSDNIFQIQLDSRSEPSLKIDQVEIVEASFFKFEEISELPLDYNVQVYLRKYFDDQF